MTARTHAALPVRAAAVVTVLDPGLQTTVQDLTGRHGLWGVGVPPSGAWDDLHFALATLAVGNPAGAAGLEFVLRGPVLRFAERALVCVTGAARQASVEGRPIRPGVVTVVPPGGTLDLGPCPGPGMRGYLAISGGIAVPEVLGSRSTFLLGGFGGLDGRALVAGDVLPLGRTENSAAPLDVAPLLPVLGGESGGDWSVRVLPGPHGAPDHLTERGFAQLFSASWQVDHRADRTGVRLVGPRPGWARADGGEAGLHPSNIHDSAYPVGAVMLSGDTPVVVGPDGPSLGGFVVPAVVIGADLWMLAQLRPGDRVRLVAVTPGQAEQARRNRDEVLADPRAAVAARFELSLSARKPSGPSSSGPSSSVVAAARPAPLQHVPADPLGHRPELSIRAAGDRHLLVEAGPPELDLAVRLWVHLLAGELAACALPGILEVVEGVRSLLVKVDPRRLGLARLADTLRACALAVPDPATVTLDVREVTLPIALDHPLAHEAMTRYARSVRPDAPWCPDNVEFIRRINDLAARDEVFSVLTSATYLVLGLGDVYLGAPVAVPIDPRHRLVTTKYDPARTWTPQNAVGIGGVYLCVYGMEGPGGYQLVGRTVPVWRPPAPGSRDRSGHSASGQPPWLLRLFDRLRFVPVHADELAELRADITSGRRELQTRPATFSLAEVAELEHRHAEEIAAFRARREAAFAAERKRWGR